MATRVDVVVCEQGQNSHCLPDPIVCVVRQSAATVCVVIQAAAIVCVVIQAAAIVCVVRQSVSRRDQ